MKKQTEKANLLKRYAIMVMLLPRAKRNCVNACDLWMKNPSDEESYERFYRCEQVLFSVKDGMRALERKLVAVGVSGKNWSMS